MPQCLLDSYYTCICTEEFYVYYGFWSLNHGITNPLTSVGGGVNQLKSLEIKFSNLPLFGISFISYLQILFCCEEIIGGVKPGAVDICHFNDRTFYVASLKRASSFRIFFPSVDLG